MNVIVPVCWGCESGARAVAHESEGRWIDDVDVGRSSRGSGGGAFVHGAKGRWIDPQPLQAYMSKYP